MMGRAKSHVVYLGEARMPTLVCAGKRVGNVVIGSHCEEPG